MNMKAPKTENDREVAEVGKCEKGCVRELKNTQLHITACARGGKHEIEKLRQKGCNRVNMSQKACKAERESLFIGRKKCASKDHAVEAMSMPETQSMCKTGTILVGEAKCPRKENTQTREERQRKE